MIVLKGYKKLKNGKPAIAYYLKYFRENYYNSRLPKINYLKVDDYIHYHHNVKKWKCYCEVLIDKNGNVAQAIPSHQQAVFRGNIVTKAKYLYKTSVADYSMEKLCDDFNVLMVWYDYCIYGNKQPTIEQVTTLYKLYAANCISYDCFKQFTLQLQGVKA